MNVSCPKDFSNKDIIASPLLYVIVRSLETLIVLVKVPTMNIFTFRLLAMKIIIVV